VVVGPTLPLPGNVVQEAVRFDATCETAPVDFWPAVRLPDGLAAAAPKRRREFLAGRTCAARALARLGLGPCEVAIDADRAPVWPAGVVGSITHSAGFAAAAVGLAAQLAGLGIDAEPIAAPSLVASVAKLILAAGEPAAPPPGMDLETYVTLVFSAKESLFKCVYPQVREPFFFEHARVTLAAVPGEFQAVLLKRFARPPELQSPIRGRYGVAHGEVHTAVALPRPAAPRAGAWSPP